MSYARAGNELCAIRTLGALPRQISGVLSDTEQLEAELAAVRADTQAEVSHAAQQQTAARRERMEADEAAEAASRSGASDPINGD